MSFQRSCIGDTRPTGFECQSISKSSSILSNKSVKKRKGDKKNSIQQLLYLPRLLSPFCIQGRRRTKMPSPSAIVSRQHGPTPLPAPHPSERRRPKLRRRRRAVATTPGLEPVWMAVLPWLNTVAAVFCEMICTVAAGTVAAGYCSNCTWYRPDYIRESILCKVL